MNNSTTLPQRSLGSSGIPVSGLGLGCNRIGEDSLTDGEWVCLLHEAADRGVTLFDTAALYSGGRSEELIDTSHADPILPVAERLGIGLLGRMPYQRGSLTGKFRAGVLVSEGRRALLQEIARIRTASG